MFDLSDSNCTGEVEVGEEVVISKGTPTGVEDQILVHIIGTRTSEVRSLVD